jgi:hypothetical protein
MLPTHYDFSEFEPRKRVPVEHVIPFLQKKEKPVIDDVLQEIPINLVTSDELINVAESKVVYIRNSQGQYEGYYLDN